MIFLRDDVTVHRNRRQATILFRPRREERHRRLRGRKGEAVVQGRGPRPWSKAVVQGLARETLPTVLRETARDVSGFNGRLGGVEVVRVTFVDRCSGMDIPDHEVEEERRNDTPLWGPHLHLPPFGRHSLVQAPNLPVTQVRDQPTLQIWVEISGIDLPKQFVVVDDVKSRLKINAEARPEGGLLFVKTPDDLDCE